MYIIDEDLERVEILKRYKHLIKLISSTASREEKRQVSEDRAAVLDQMTGLLKKKDRVEVVFHDRDCYRRIEGTVETVDRIGRKLCLEGRKIPFEDVWEIHRKKRP